MKTETKLVEVTTHDCNVGEWIAIFRPTTYSIKRTCGVVVEKDEEYMRVWFPLEKEIVSVRYDYTMESPDEEELRFFFRKVSEEKKL